MANLIQGNISRDQRGVLKYNNDFDLTEIKRLYIIQNDSKNIIRGWQGHKIEQRWFTSISGIFKINLIEIDNWEKPSKSLEIKTFTLNDKKPKILFIPGGFAHGYKTLTTDTSLIVFSTATLSESKNDDYRFEAYYWNPWEKKER